MIRLLALSLLLAATPAVAAPWAPLIGTWRTADYESCGVDDVRYGRITSVGERSLLLGFVHCVIESGARKGEVIHTTAECDLGAGYMTRLEHEWRLDGETLTMRHEGYETRLVRCAGGVE